MRLVVSKEERKTLVPQSELEFSRREFLSYFTLGGIASVVAIAAKTDAPERFANRPFKERFEEEFKQNRRGAVSTLVETMVAWIGVYLASHGLEKLGIESGGSAAEGQLYQESIEKNPAGTYARDNVIIPILEELAFRFIPSALIDGKERGQIRWDVGLTSSAIFALIHTVAHPEDDKFTVSLTRLPLEQFILGSFCWYLQRKGGTLHAIGAHLLYNNMWAAYEKHQLNLMKASKQAESSNSESN